MERSEERLGVTEGAQDAVSRLARASKPRGTRRQRAAAEDDAMPDERLTADLDEEGETWSEGDGDDDLLSVFRDSLHQTVLPQLPELRGYHVCWLTRSNPRDSIQWRMRIGYSLLRYEDFPKWDGGIALAGDKDLNGPIEVNEMVAAKIPLRLYNKYMREVHHNMPLAEEMKLREAVDSMKSQAEMRGARVLEGDGTANVVQRAKPMPDFDA